MKNIIKKGIMFSMLLCLCLMNFVYANSGNIEQNKNIKSVEIKNTTIKISKNSLAIYKGKDSKSIVGV